MKKSSMARTLILSFVLWQLLLLPCSCRNLVPKAAVEADDGGGKWDLLQSNIGIIAMHMQLLNNDKVVIYDRTDYGLSNISLPDGKCRHDPNEKALKVDCTAHSVEYDVVKNSIRPLTVQTDIWCSSGSTTINGTLIQTGGFNDGDHAVRIYKPCDGKCDWEEIPNGLVQRRWYSTNHILPDGERQIIVGGRRQFNYEFYPKSGDTDKGARYLRFLVETNDPVIENNLYPFVFLNTDGNFFIFANNKAILFDYKKDVVAKTYPQIPGGEPRSYPSTGSAVLLPLNGSTMEAEVLVCGGAPVGSYDAARKKKFMEALNTCGRIKITDKNPQWVMETMPMSRVMGDMILLPNGHILIINGASSGTAGWEYARNPVLNPVVYRPDNPIGKRFQVQNPTSIPRMYHSTAILLRDGRILVGGNNPHILYNFTNVLYPTELRMEAFSPSYLHQDVQNLRPRIISPRSHSEFGYGHFLSVDFNIPGLVKQDSIKVTMVSPSFNTHSFSMNQRLLVLNMNSFKTVGKSTHNVEVVTPVNNYLAPSGYYLLFVVHQDIPSEGIWVRLL